MKSYDICYCIYPNKIAAMYISRADGITNMDDAISAMADEWEVLMRYLYYLFLPFYANKEDGQWVIEKKIESDPGCRSIGQQKLGIQTDKCHTSYNFDASRMTNDVTQIDGVAEEYGKSRLVGDQYCLVASYAIPADLSTIPIPDEDDANTPWRWGTCTKFTFPDGDSLIKSVNETAKFIDQVLLDTLQSAQIMVLQVHIYVV